MTFCDIRCTLVALFLWVAGAFVVRGFIADIPISPNDLDQREYRFCVASKPALGGIHFRLMISAKKGAFQAGSTFYLCVFKMTTNTAVATPIKSNVPLSVKKQDKVWTIEFTAPADLLRNSDICAVFQVIPSVLEKDGKRDFEFGGTDYMIKLRDFMDKGH